MFIVLKITIYKHRMTATENQEPTTVNRTYSHTPSVEQLCPLMTSNGLSGFCCLHSANDFSILSKKTSGGCAPEMAYLRLRTKNGTPLTPISLASIMS